MARTYRDAYGVPHVRASSVLDLAHGQGVVTAHDRVWQLELQRRRATGTLAEVFGASGVDWDRLARRTRVADTARRAHAALETETQEFVAAYVDGVNAGLHADAPELAQLGIEPEPWQPWTPLAVFLVQHLLFASLPGKLWTTRAREVLGEDAALLSHEGPLTNGSNAWAVGGARTASGLPLLAGDPHRAFESPGVDMQVRLACDELDVAGFAFPGVPGVQHFAHAGEVAWAITNGMADYQDAYAERLRRRAGRVEALGPDGWEPAESRVEAIAVRGEDEVQVEVVTTRRGPVFSGGVDAGAGLSLRTASDVLGDLGFDAFLPLLRARTVDDVDAALDRWVEPVNNAVVADRAGAVRYRLAGRVPVRPEANRLGVVAAADPGSAWSGWLAPLPRQDLPPSGVVVTANERRGPESDPVGTTFAARHRAERLRALVGERTGLTAGDFAAFHGDTRLPTLDLVHRVVAQAEPGPVRETILGWDGRMDAGSAGAAAFAAWRSALVLRLAAQPVFAPLADAVTDEPALLPWLDPTARISVAVESLLEAGTPFGIDVVALSGLALRDAADHAGHAGQAATWGDRHVFRAVHAFDVLGEGLEPPPLPEVPVAGDADCVRCTASTPGVDDAAWRGSVARYVWDLADRAAGGWVVPLGAAGDERDRHHADQLPLWADARLAPLVTDWDQLHAEAGGRGHG